MLSDLPPETFIIVFADGPYPGAYEAPAVLKWPMPERVKAQAFSTGCYLKVRESTALPVSDSEARGAMYKWDEKAVYDPRRDGI